MGPVIPHLKVYNFQFSAEQRWADIPQSFLSFSFSILPKLWARTLISGRGIFGGLPHFIGNNNYTIIKRKLTACTRSEIVCK